MADLDNFLSANDAPIAQQNRLVKLDTPLGPDVLLLQCVGAHEERHDGYTYLMDGPSMLYKLELR